MFPPFNCDRSSEEQRHVRFSTTIGSASIMYQWKLLRQNKIESTWEGIYTLLRKFAKLLHQRPANTDKRLSFLILKFKRFDGMIVNVFLQKYVYHHPSECSEPSIKCNMKAHKINLKRCSSRSLSIIYLIYQIISSLENFRSTLNWLRMPSCRFQSDGKIGNGQMIISDSMKLSSATSFRKAKASYSTFRLQMRFSYSTPKFWKNVFVSRWTVFDICVAVFVSVRYIYD